jgi:hypothetical protein
MHWDLQISIQAGQRGNIFRLRQEEEDLQFHRSLKPTESEIPLHWCGEPQASTLEMFQVATTGCNLQNKFHPPKRKSLP